MSKIDEFILSDSTDLRNYLEIVLGEINKSNYLNRQLEDDVINKICDSIISKNVIEEFHRQNENWPNWFEVINERLFIDLIKFHKSFKNALIDCNEFDLLECIEEHANFESFYKFVEKSSRLDKEYEIVDMGFMEENIKKSIYILAHKVYLKSKRCNRDQLGKFPIFAELSEESNKQVQIYNGLAAIVLGSIGTVGIGISAGACSPLIIGSGLVGGYVLSTLFVRPYLEDYFATKEYRQLIEELNSFEYVEPDEVLYEKSLYRLNLARDSNNEQVKTARRNYLAAFNMEKCNQTELKRFLDLEKAFKIIKNYRKKNNIWD